MDFKYPGLAGAYSPLNFRHELIALYDFRPNDSDGFFKASSSRADISDFKVVGIHGAVRAVLNGSNTLDDNAKLIREKEEAVEIGIGEYMLDMIAYVDSIIPNSSHKSKFYIGLGTSVAGTALLDGIWFEYDENDTNWQCVTASGGTETKTNSGVAIAATTKYDLKIIANTGGTSIQFFVNENLVATHTTNITAVLLSPILYGRCHTTHAEAGEAALVVDAFCELQVLTNPR